MGKHKQAKEKKFDRNVEISAPILDPEIIKAIHSPPRGQRLDLKHGGFKALLSDLNSQDSTDEMSPLNENHVPSYIGISCAVSGYSNYSSYAKRPSASPITTRAQTQNVYSGNRSRTTSPTATNKNPALGNEHHHQHQQVHHITVDKNTIQSPDEERKELTEKLIASAAEHRRDPSPIPPTEDDRHHGAYVGARYFPLPAPDKVVNKHIPLLGIDDDQNPDDIINDESQKNKVEQKIANLYGDEFVEDWRESMTHKAKKELPAEDQDEQQAVLRNPKDLVTLKPTPPQAKKEEEEQQQPPMADVPTPNVKVLAGVEKQFLNKLLTDENPPTPSPPPYLQSPVKETKLEEQEKRRDSPKSPISSPVQAEAKIQKLPTSPPTPVQAEKEVKEDTQHSKTVEETATEKPPTGEEHIEYEIRAQSPVDNEASPVRIRSEAEPEKVEKVEKVQPANVTESLVSFTPEPISITSVGSTEEIKTENVVEKSQSVEQMQELDQHRSQPSTDQSEINDGRYYLNLLDQEKSFILSQVAEAEALLLEKESELDEDATGRIRSAIGKANLLVNKKCNQFKELCESNINASASEQYVTLNDDLAGFWDMIRIQIEDVRKSFENIWIAKANNWTPAAADTTAKLTAAESGSDESRESSLKDRVSSKPKLSAQKDQERRERLKEHINQMKQNQAVKNIENVTSIGDQDQAEADLEQVGCDVIESVVASSQAATEAISQQVEEAEEQLFSLMGSTSSPPPATPEVPQIPADGQNKEEQPTEKPSEDLLNLLD